MGEIICVQNCSYQYEDGTKALKNISFSIQKGEKVVFLGGNGSGKSTLFLCMNGILRPKKGKTEMRGWKEKGCGMYGRMVLQKGCRDRREKEGRRGWWEL